MEVNTRPVIVRPTLEQNLAGEDYSAIKTIEDMKALYKKDGDHHGCY
jgi:hypothetical protein